jgi:hypothetical protein
LLCTLQWQCAISSAAANTAAAAAAKIPQAYQNLPSSGKLEAALDDVKDAAAAAGFKPRQSGWGELLVRYITGWGHFEALGFVDINL